MSNAPTPMRAMHRRGLSLLFAALFAAAALAIHLQDLNAFVTTDEPKWASRSIQFYQALAGGHLEKTLQAGHPGVLTLWLGAPAMGIVPAGQGLLAGNKVALDKLLLVSSQTPFTEADIIYAGRRGVAAATAVILGIAYLLLERLLGRRAAILAGTLLLVDPFYLAHSRLLHVDALAAGTLFLYLLSLAVALREDKRRFMALSGLCAGLAMLSKSPSMIAMPLTALVIVPVWLARRRPFAWLLRSGAAWLVPAVAAYFAFWPAMWVQPAATLRAVFDTALMYAGEAHGLGNFFWNAPRPDPGPAFYPVVLIFRLTPWAVLGSLLSIPWVLPRRTSAQSQPARAATLYRPLLWALWGFVLIYMLFMASGEKKFDRYLLPVFPCMQGIAALGYLASFEWLQGRLESRAVRNGLYSAASRLYLILRNSASWLCAATVTAIVALGAATVLPHAPYYLTYYNPLVGGPKAAVKTLLVGWGEGLDLAADYLNKLPGIEEKRTCAGQVQNLAPMFHGRLYEPQEYDATRTNYVLLYVNEVQRGLQGNLLERYYGVVLPLHVVTLQGIDYAWIYENKSYEQPMAYIAAHGNVATDAVVLSRRGLFSENYHQALPLFVLKANWTREQLQGNLQRIADQAKRVWYVRYADVEPDPVLDWVDEEWQRDTVVLEEHSFQDITLSLREIKGGGVANR